MDIEWAHCRYIQSAWVMIIIIVIVIIATTMVLCTNC